MINAIVLVPEITKGMKSVGSKSLLPIKNNKYLIEYQIEQISTINKSIHITIATGFDHDKILKITKPYNNVDILYNSHYEYTNFGKSLELYIKNYSSIDNVLVISSGILFKKGALISSYCKNSSKIFVLDKPKNHFEIGCNPTKHTEYLFYDLPQIWSECVYFNIEAITALKKIISTKSIAQMYLFEIINEILSHKIMFEKQLVPKSNFLKVTGVKDLSRAKVFI